MKDIPKVPKKVLNGTFYQRPSEMDMSGREDGKSDWDDLTDLVHIFPAPVRDLCSRADIAINCSHRHVCVAGLS